MELAVPGSAAIVYPDSDGKPMAENTLQAEWIVVLFGNLRAHFRDRSDVFVAADLLWYPVEGENAIAQAPDVLVVLGRPKGYRGSYRQWEEDNVPLTVVFEVLSPSNDAFEMSDKLAFYDEHGVEEYYVFDPERTRLAIYQRGKEALRRLWPNWPFVSPRLGVSFDPRGDDLVICYPSGRRFLSFEEVEADRLLAEQRANDAEQRASDAVQRADKAELATAEAVKRAGQLAQQAERLAELSRKLLQQQITPDEAEELRRLVQERASPG